jgi:glycosyltransferase involved in cell wall biosynthesis
MQPKVSVIMPVYNAETYLCCSLESVLAQTLRDIEVICVNDGSTDSSSDILAEYAAADPRVRVIDKENAGYGAAMNDGIDAATGDFVGVVEPDDYVDTDMFEDLYATAISHRCDVVKCDFFSLEGSGSDAHTTWNEICPGKCFYDVTFDSTKSNALFYVMMMTWEGIYRTSFLRDHGIRHNETPGASFQDNGFWWQVFTFAKRVRFVNRAHYYYRMDNPNSSINTSEAATRIDQEYAFVLDFLKSDEDRWERLRFIYAYFYFDNLLARMSQLRGPELVRLARLLGTEYQRYKREGNIDLSLFPPFMVEEFELIAGDPDTYDPSAHPDVIAVSFAEVFDRHERTEILRESCSPYSVVRDYANCIVSDRSDE